MLRMLVGLLAVGMLAQAAAAAEKDKPKQGRADDETGALHVTWYPSVAAAVDVAKANYVPVMVLIFREGNKDDLRRVENVEGWPTIIQASHEQMAATKLSDQNDEAKAIVQRLQLKRLPAVVWLDRDANPVIATAFTDSAATMTAVIQGWGQTLDTIAKFYSKHLIAGNKYLARGRLRSAYLEYAFLAPFQGKDPDLARRGQDRVREAWLKTLARAKELPPESVERVVIIKGLRRDVQFLDFAKTLEEEIHRAPQVAAERPRPAATPPAAPAEAPKEGEAAKPAEPAAPAAPVIAALTIKEPEPAGPAQAQQAMPATEDKPLVDAMKVQVSNTAYAADTGTAEDATINLNYLINHKDPACKEAGTNFQKALETYKKAINDVKELGAERNKLLQAAADGFDKGITGLEKVLEKTPEKTPDPAIDRVMQQVAMIMYACLKYQSL